jgi:O-methyltransferase involved in polyketide biosynthesis
MLLVTLDSLANQLAKSMRKPKSQRSGAVHEATVKQAVVKVAISKPARGNGASQVVLLGSGLDTKAWRLDFPSGTAIFEVDQRDMSGFKQRRLAASKAQMDAASDVAGFKHRLKADSWASVGTDLMHPDWVADLDSSGFQKGALPAFSITKILVVTQFAVSIKDLVRLATLY